MLDEISEREYPAPPLPELKENLKGLEPRLRILLDERFDAYGRVLASYAVIARNNGISVEHTKELIETALWQLAGKPAKIHA